LPEFPGIYKRSASLKQRQKVKKEGRKKSREKCIMVEKKKEFPGDGESSFCNSCASEKKKSNED
jgi:hypothetical protein